MEVCWFEVGGFDVLVEEMRFVFMILVSNVCMCVFFRCAFERDHCPHFLVFLPVSLVWDANPWRRQLAEAGHRLERLSRDFAARQRDVDRKERTGASLYGRTLGPSSDRKGLPDFRLSRLRLDLFPAVFQFRGGITQT